MITFDDVCSDLGKKLRDIIDRIKTYKFLKCIF
jgi:hypothetical protein